MKLQSSLNAARWGISNGDQPSSGAGAQSLGLLRITSGHRTTWRTEMDLEDPYDHHYRPRLAGCPDGERYSTISPTCFQDAKPKFLEAGTGAGEMVNRAMAG